MLKYFCIENIFWKIIIKIVRRQWNEPIGGVVWLMLAQRLVHAEQSNYVKSSWIQQNHQPMERNYSKKQQQKTEINADWNLFTYFAFNAFNWTL